MVDDLDDPYAELREMKEQIRILMSANPLQASSVSDGSLTFLGGLLRIADGGTFDGTGTFVWSGPWRFDSGDGEIAGDVGLIGNFDLTGVFTSGNVRIEAGKIYVGTGANQIVIDGTTGNIIAGAMRIDPSASGGAVVFDTGAELRSEGDLTWLVHGNNGVAVDENQVIVRYGARQLRIAADGVKITGLPTRSGTGLLPDTLAADADGTVWRAT